MNETNSDYVAPGEGVLLEDITGFGEIVRAGRYPSRLAKCEAKLSKKQKWMVQANWEITEGDQEGLEQPTWYSLVITRKKDKRGAVKVYAGGIMSMKRDMKNVGAEFPAGFIFSEAPDEKYAIEVARIFTKAFGGGAKLVEMNVLKDTKSPVMDDEGNERRYEEDGIDHKAGDVIYRTKTVITGPWGRQRPGAVTAAAPTATSPSAALEAAL